MEENIAILTGQIQSFHRVTQSFSWFTNRVPDDTLNMQGAPQNALQSQNDKGEDIMNLKKLLALALSMLMLALALVGCAAQTTEPAKQDPAANTAQTAPAQQTDEQAEPTGEVAELLYWDMLFGAADVYEPTVQGLVDQFNSEHPDIHVTVQFHSWDNYYQEYLTSVTSGMAPDVTNGYFGIANEYARMGEILDLSSIVDEWKESGLYDEFPAGSIELHQAEGIQAGLPWNIDARMTVYNKEIFEQAGVTELPTNWEEFKEVCRVIKEKTGVTPYVVAGGCNHNDQMTCHMMLGNGVNVTDADGNAAFDSQGAIETLQFFGDLMDEGLMAEGCAGYTESDVLQLFANGEVAIWSGNTPSSIATPEFIDKIGVMPNFPAKEGGEARGLGFFNSMVAFKQSKYPEACKVFLKWYIEHSLPLFTQGGVTTLPIMDSQLQDPFYQDNALLKQVVENVIPTTVPAVWPCAEIYPAYAQITGEGLVGLALQEVLTGNRDYEQIAQKYNEKIAAAIADAQ